MKPTVLGVVGVVLLASCTSPNRTQPQTTGGAGSSGPTGAAGTSVAAAGSTGQGAAGTSVAAAGSTGQSGAGRPGTAAGAAGTSAPTGDASASDGPVKQTPGKLTFRKITIHETELAESASIGDFNRDGNPDIVSGRRWYEGPDFVT